MTRLMAQKLREFRNENPDKKSSDRRSNESETKNIKLPKWACASRKTLKQQSDNNHVQTNQRANKYDAIINSASKKYNLPPELIKAVIKVESDFTEHAVSPKGAQGLMQLMPCTAIELGVSDPFDPRKNVHGGSRLLKQHLEKYCSLKKALIAYNAGPRWTKRIQIPKETRNYIKNVIHFYGYYKKSR
ncbi:MAG: transglycosylase SLT domain-containing protein [Desulfobacteraceae bacterium]|nr:transglycosylase SLT domain-containing protein [Desulfobacteraceae bacterium]MBC2755210.1 transglycosylase SLT domain-containing protein [Desulfobacteraceae bacterium]